MGSPLESLAAALAIAAALWGMGRPLVRRLAPDADPAMNGLLSVALGVVVWQSLLALLLAGRCWEIAPIGVLTALGAIWALIVYCCEPTR